MKYEILQLNDKSEDLMFESYDYIKSKFDIDNYDVVYEGEIDDTDKETGDILEDIYVHFNMFIPKGFKGHSMSMSDVIRLNGESYYCDRFGFVKI